jgi:hypothetical protein
MSIPRTLARTVLPLVALALLVVACVMPSPGRAARHRWWSGLGPVLPHETFPGDCQLCHEGDRWHELKDTFEYDHEARTGVALEGAHAAARCLRCHNDRGPVAFFQAQGCSGCHEDVHRGALGPRCDDCHTQASWVPFGQMEKHRQTRFPLYGVHAVTSCRRCHPASEIGVFTPTDTECVTCHVDDLNRTTNHVGLGWVDRCDRCHMPTAWEQAEAD